MPQSLTVDYLVTGALDGSTPAPVVRDELPDVTPRDPHTQIYKPDAVPLLGLIDPDLAAGGSVGPRCISQLVVDLAGEVAPAGARVTAVGQRGSETYELFEVLDLAGKTSDSLAVPVVVPQGASLQLEGVSAGPAGISVRVSIDTPQNPAELRALLDFAREVGALKKDEKGCAWNPTDTYWVDVGYTGGDSDGTPCKPFTTIQEAIDLAWAEVASKQFERYATVIVAPGVYQEVSLLFYPFVTVVGLDEDSTRIRSTNPIDLFSFGYYNLHHLRFESEWAVDMTSVPYFGWYVWCRTWNCRFDAPFQANGLGAFWHWFEHHEAYFNSGADMDLQNLTWWCSDCTIYAALMDVKATAQGTHTFTGKDGNQYATGVYLYDAFSTADVDVTQPSGAAGTWVETATRLFAAISADGAGTAVCTVETTADGYPEDGLTLSNGAVQLPSGNALGLLYAPAVPGDWANPPPETVGEALDRLAAANPGA